ncbi:MAG: hypothetical protein HY314_02610 [Acidobacteria bacterium]|nr:hypothetical protein [Acidobacteriota bacterium]
MNIKIIDTKGIDQTAMRGDLEGYFDDSRTLIVLCSRFFDAPELAIQLLLRHAKEASAKDIVYKTIILVLPRPEEAIAMKDDTGMAVGDKEEGYELKREQTSVALNRLGLDGIPIHFFNAREDREDEYEDLRKRLVDRIQQLRSIYRNRVSDGRESRL